MDLKVVLNSTYGLKTSKRRNVPFFQASFDLLGAKVSELKKENNLNHKSRRINKYYVTKIPTRFLLNDKQDHWVNDIKIFQIEHEDKVLDKLFSSKAKIRKENFRLRSLKDALREIKFELPSDCPKINNTISKPVCESHLSDNHSTSTEDIDSNFLFYNLREGHQQNSLAKTKGENVDALVYSQLKQVCQERGHDYEEILNHYTRNTAFTREVNHYLSNRFHFTD